MRRDPLVVGVGNLDRGDDGAGLWAIRRLHGARTKEVTDCTQLIEIWADEADVVVIDAMVTGAPVGTVSRFDIGAFPLPVGTFPSTHSFGLAETVELARAIGRLPGRLTVFGIEAGQMDLGAALSTDVDRAIDGLVEDLEAVMA